jgi:hypothetical protein
VTVSVQVVNIIYRIREEDARRNIAVPIDIEIPAGTSRADAADRQRAAIPEIDQKHSLAEYEFELGHAYAVAFGAYLCMGFGFCAGSRLGCLASKAGGVIDAA